jgi:hypothetical protein
MEKSGEHADLSAHSQERDESRRSFAFARLRAKNRRASAPVSSLANGHAGIRSKPRGCAYEDCDITKAPTQAFTKQPIRIQTLRLQHKNHSRSAQSRHDAMLDESLPSMCTCTRL